MRVLMLSQWYPPEPNFKTHVLAQSLVNQGHQVTVLTGFPNYPTGKLYPGYRQRLWQIENQNNLRVIRVPLYPDHSRSGLRRVLNYFSFALSASTIGAVLCGPADVMWVYHPPLTVGIPACWIRLIRRIPYVYEVQDIWPETLTATGMLPSSRVACALGVFAKFIYRHAMAIIVISSGFKRNLIEKGVPGDKIHFFPNWADEEIFRPVSRSDALAAEYGLAGRFNVIFGGNMGAAQALGSVLEAAAQLRDMPTVQFVLIGDGIVEAQLRHLAAERGLDNVRFIGRQPANRMPEFFAWADALLAHLKRDPLFEITIPSKIIAYLACGRPIICAVSGDAAEVVLEAGAGIVCHPEDPVALAAAVRAMYAMPAAQRAALGQAGREMFLAKYTRAVLMAQYQALFAEVAEAKHGGRRQPNAFADPLVKTSHGSPK